ncbi:MAG: EMC3/TMCO1 family protein [Nanoarchaeota archaeon]|nr:EMC3/TMCO1 family protein [Nanoarchaeota archaeon]
MVLESIFDPTLGRVLNSLPQPWGLLIISFLLTALITLVYKYATDQEIMGTLKGDIKSLQNEMKQFKDNPSKAMELQKKAMSKNMEYMKYSFKPMLITFIPLIIIFGWLRGHYTVIGNPDVFFGLSWLWSYIIFSMVFSILIRKILKVH